MHNDDPESRAATRTDGLSRLAALVAARLGLHFPDSRQKDLLRAARALARDQGREDTEAYLQSLLAAPLTDRQVAILVEHLTVVETYFFREMQSLAAFRDHVVPELIRKRAGVPPRLRIWSAGCCTGEEAYSLAMLLADLVPTPGHWDIHIRGTDVNAAALDKARRGVYTEWSFRGMPEHVRARHFKPHGPTAFEVRSRYKGMVAFDCLNLATDPYPSLQNDTNAMDVIFCRNVLMYMVPDRARAVLAAFERCLVEDGWLIVAPSECTLLQGSGFTPVIFDGATLYRKAHPPPAPAATPARGVPLAPPFVKPPPLRVDRATQARPSVRKVTAYDDALAAYREGRYDEAMAALQPLLDTGTAVARDSGAAGRAFALMARIEANRGKLEDAAEWSQKAIAVDRVNPGFYYLLATILEEQHRPADAAQALQRALYLDSSFVLAHYALGTIALREQGRKAADRHFLNGAALLARLPKQEVLPESEGLTAGRLLEIIQTLTAAKEARP